MMSAQDQRAQKGTATKPGMPADANLSRRAPTRDRQSHRRCRPPSRRIGSESAREPGSQRTARHASRRHPPPSPPNTGDKLRSGARVRSGRRGHEAACPSWQPCRRKLRQLHPLVRRPAFDPTVYYVREAPRRSFRRSRLGRVRRLQHGLLADTDPVGDLGWRSSCLDGDGRADVPWSRAAHRLDR